MIKLPFNNSLYFKNNLYNEQNPKNSSNFEQPLLDTSDDSRRDSKNSPPLFSVLGFDIYLDDVIILGIIYFLYKEKVKDDMLYIVLLLILIS